MDASKGLTEEDFAEIELAASMVMREWERGYVCQDINVRHHISWWIMQETAKLVASNQSESVEGELLHGMDSDAEYLRWLAERLMCVPVMHGTDGFDIDVLNDMARRLS